MSGGGIENPQTPPRYATDRNSQNWQIFSSDVCIGLSVWNTFNFIYFSVSRSGRLFISFGILQVYYLRAREIIVVKLTRLLPVDTYIYIYIYKCSSTTPLFVGATCSYNSFLSVQEVYAGPTGKRGLRCMSVAIRLLRLRVRIPPGAWMSLCCVLSGRGLCDELITRPEKFYWLWCVVLCDLETSRMRRPRPTGGLSRQTTKTRRRLLKFLKPSTKRINESTFLEKMRVLLASVYQYKGKVWFYTKGLSVKQPS
jgi:hypothetical protein